MKLQVVVVEVAVEVCFKKLYKNFFLQFLTAPISYSTCKWFFPKSRA